MAKISLVGLDKAEVLAALYNASRPQGMGFIQYDPKPMTKTEAEKLLKQTTDFDYLNGRVMKIDLSGDDLDTWGYDRDNGTDAALLVIEALRKTGNTNPASVQIRHEEGKERAADQVEQALNSETTISSEDSDFTVVRLGLRDVAGPLKKAVDKATRPRG